MRIEINPTFVVAVGLGLLVGCGGGSPPVDPDPDMSEVVQQPDLAKPDLSDPPEACVPKSCKELNATCGKVLDNCKKHQNCGTCEATALCTDEHQCLPYCGDGALDGTETDVDCGGADATCARCALGQKCAAQSDCGAGLTCQSGLCLAGTYTALAAMPTQRGFAAVAVHDDLIYVLGGFAASTTLSKVEVYSTTTDSWSSLPAMTSARAGFGAAFDSDGKLYAVGGEMGNNWADGQSRSGEVFDVGKNTWTALPTLANQHDSGRIAFAANGDLYMIGGTRKITKQSGAVTSYRHDAAATAEKLASGGGAWTSSPMTLLSGRESFGLATLGDGSVLIAGGEYWWQNSSYDPGCVGYCPVDELRAGVGSIERCTLGGSCTQLATFPTATTSYPNYEVGVARVDDDHVYIFGVNDQTTTSSAYRLDLATKALTRIAAVPTIGVNGAVVVGGKIYVVTQKALFLFNP